MNQDSGKEQAARNAEVGDAERHQSTISKNGLGDGATYPTREVGAQARTNRLRYQIASTMMDREAAFRLVYRVYRQYGLQQPNPNQMRVLPQHLLSTTQVFIAKAGDQVISTLSLVVDNARHGVPMESTFQQQIAQRRATNIKFGEVCCFADGNRRFRSFFRELGELTRLMVQYARGQGMAQLLVAVHPHHARFYTRMMGFERIGPVTRYPGVRHRPAVPLCLDFEHIDRHPPVCYGRYFAERISSDELVPQAMTTAERAYFARMIDTTAVGNQGPAVGKRTAVLWQPIFWRRPPDVAAG